VSEWGYSDGLCGNLFRESACSNGERGRGGGTILSRLQIGNEYYDFCNHSLILSVLELNINGITGNGLHFFGLFNSRLYL